MNASFTTNGIASIRPPMPFLSAAMQLAPALCAALPSAMASDSLYCRQLVRPVSGRCYRLAGLVEASAEQCVLPFKVARATRRLVAEVLESLDEGMMW